MAEKIAVLMGSESDREVMHPCFELLDQFDVEYETHVLSAHRTPDKVSDFAKCAESNGFKVIIAAAGGAAHLAGAVAANTVLPVVGVPIDSSPLQGLDALLSTVQMPGGVPVATVSIGRWGAKNAAVLALEILALHNETLRSRLLSFRGIK